VTSDKLQQSIDRRGVATVVLNRPDVHNAFDDALIAELTATLKSLEREDSARVVVLAAAGRSFSAGADLNWMKRMAEYSRMENVEDAVALAQLMQTLHRLAKPTIALVQGPAYGGGVGLVSCCDVAVASEQAHFCLSEVKLGLIPAVIAPYVVAAVGPRAASRYFVTAERFDAREALALGLVHEVVATDALEAARDRFVDALLKNAPQAMVEAKRLVKAVAWRRIEGDVLNDTAERIADRRASAEGREGVTAFLEKRKPAWITDD